MFELPFSTLSMQKSGSYNSLVSLPRNDMDSTHFVEIRNRSDSRWSYICIDNCFGNYSGDYDTCTGTLDRGEVVRNYHKRTDFPGIIYLCRGINTPEECKQKYYMRYQYNSIFKPVLSIEGDRGSGYKFRCEFPNFAPKLYAIPSEPKLQHQPSELHLKLKQWHKEALRTNLWELFCKMQCFEVILYMFSKRCMTLAEKQQLSADPKMPIKQNDRLVTWLIMQPMETFKIFCDALDKTCQADLSLPLRDCLLNVFERT